MTSLAARATILVVEDDPVLRRLYRVTLTAAGYAVVAFEDGLDALHWIESHVPSAIILDLELPRLGGRDVQQELKSHLETRDIPIMVVTGTDANDLNEADFDCVLRKPLDLESFISALRRCLQRSGRWRDTT